MYVPDARGHERRPREARWTRATSGSASAPGIGERRYVEPGQTPVRARRSVAAQRALAAAGLEPGEIDCIVLATLSAAGRLPGHVVLPARPARARRDARASTCARSAAASSTRSSVANALRAQRASSGACSWSAARSTRPASTSSPRAATWRCCSATARARWWSRRTTTRTTRAAILEVRLHAEGKYAEQALDRGAGLGLPADADHRTS